jgi:hypothetical protein
VKWDPDEEVLGSQRLLVFLLSGHCGQNNLRATKSGSGQLVARSSLDTGWMSAVW